MARVRHYLTAGDYAATIRAMPMPWSRIGVAALVVGASTPAAAQRTTHDNFNSWYILSTDAGLSERWTTQWDVQERRSGPIEQPQAFFLRGGLGYSVNPAVKLGFGAAYSESYPSGEIPSAYQAPERRIFEQLQLGHTIGTVGVTHRYRLEQRWQGRRGADTSNHEITNWMTSGRVRYLLKGVKPAGDIYLTGSNEVFVAYGKNVGFNVFDQDRLGATIGRKLGRSWKAEVGVLEQLSLKSNGKDIERNHTITFGGYYSRPWSK